MDPKIREISETNSDFTISQTMLGRTAFTIVKKSDIDKIKSILSKYHPINVSKISFEGAYVVI